MVGRIVCPDCGVDMEISRIGVVVKLKGYIGYFKADEWKCPVCGKKVLAGFGREFLDYDGDVDYNFVEGW